MSDDLSSKTCTPWRGGIPPLSIAEAEGFLAQAPGWALADDGRRIERSFRFKNERPRRRIGVMHNTL